MFKVPSRGDNITLQETLRSSSRSLLEYQILFTQLNSLSHTFSAHSSAICDVKSSGDVVVSSDDMGNLVVWKAAGSRLEPVSKINGFGLVNLV